MGVYSAEVQDEIQNASLANLGVILMDTVDSLIADGSPEDIEEAYGTIGREVIRRCPDVVKLEHLLDFHYNKFKQTQKEWFKGNASFDQSNDAFYEFKAMMTGFQEAYSKD